MMYKSKLATDLLRRALTACVLGAIVLYLLFSGKPQFLFLSSLVIVIGAFEWSVFANFVKIYFKIFYSLLVLGVGIGTYFLGRFFDFSYFIVLLGICFWLCVFLMVLRYEDWKMNALQSSSALVLVGFLVFLFASSSIGYLYDVDPFIVLVLFVTVWCVDTFAYVGGKVFGRHKFVPRISPNKTWEGVFFGAIGGAAAIYLLNFNYLSLSLLPLLLLFFSTFIAAVIGDLFESLLKRIRGVKDTGRLFPGHGGMLDRIDSLLAAAPAFAGTLMIIGHI